MTPPCVSVYIVCQTPEGPRYLLLKRCGAFLPGTWQMVTGKIEGNETAVQGAKREVREETGLIPTSFYSADAVETFYMLSQDKVTFVPVFIAFVEEMNVALSPKEHDAYEWLPFEEARNRLVWSEQKRILAHVHETCVLQKPHPLLACELTP